MAKAYYKGTDGVIKPLKGVRIKGTDAPKGKWELIERIEATVNTVISRTQEPNGTPYNFQAMKVVCKSGLTPFKMIFQILSGGTVLNEKYFPFTAENQIANIWTENDRGIWKNRYYNDPKATGTMAFVSESAEFPKEKNGSITEFKSNNALTQGGIAEIWAVRE